jgi:hypothetical protein
MFWMVIAWVAAIAISVALTPKPQMTQPTAAGLGDFNVPTAEEGREIPVLFGTRDITGPNCVWYGDLRAVPVKKKGGKK